MPLPPVLCIHSVLPKQVMISLCFPSSDFPSVKIVSFNFRVEMQSFILNEEPGYLHLFHLKKKKKYPLVAERKRWRYRSSSNSISSSCSGVKTPILRTYSVIHKDQEGSFKGGHEIAQLLIYPEILYSGNKYSMLPSALEDFLYKEGTTRLNTKKRLWLVLLLESSLLTPPQEKSHFANNGFFWVHSTSMTGLLSQTATTTIWSAKGWCYWIQ